MHHQFLELVVNRHMLLTLVDKNSNLTIQQSIIKNSNKKVIKLILEIIKNTLKGNIPINKRKKQKLGRYKSVLRGLFKNKKNINKKRQTIQKILKVVVTILKNFFSSLLWKKIIQNVK